MNIFLNNDFDEKIVLNDLEQELYDALMDEYNDIFENILNISEKNLFDTIINNVRAIFGEKKMKSFSKITMARSLSTLKINNYMQDFLSLKNIKEMILSLGNKDHNKKIPELKIDEIYAHCKDCSKCYHTCGEILLNPHNYNYIFCLKCKMIYKKDLIHLYCKECSEEYYSYIIDYNEPIYEDYFPATWDKYHCPNFICEEMACPECDSMLYYNDKKKILKCFGCNWNHLLKDMKWKCELCDEEFSSGVKEYVKFETKPLVNCVRNALVNKIPARPIECPCCGAEPRLYMFKHYEKKCKGVLYLGYLQKKEMTVCSLCRLVQKLKEVKWICPKCGDSFYCSKTKNTNKKGIEYRKNNYLLKPVSTLENDKDIFDKKLKLNEMKMKMAGAGTRNSDNYGNNRLTRGKSFSKKMVFGLFSDERDKIRKENRRLPTSRLINNVNLIKNNYNGNNDSNSKKNFEIKEEDEFDLNENPKNEFKNSNNNINIMNNNNNNNNDNDIIIHHSKTNNFEKISNYILSKKNSKENRSPKGIILNHLQNPMLLGDKKLKNYDNNNHFSQKDIYKTDFINENSRSRFSQNQKMINYNKKLFKNNIERYSLLNGNNSNHKKNNFMPKSDKNISLNLQININNINFNNVPLADKNNYTNSRANTGTLSGRIDNIKKNQKLMKLLEKEYENAITEIEPDENFIPEDFDIIKQIGEGTFGKIYCIEWPKNKKKYAMKKMILRTMEELNINQEKTNILFNFIKKTHCNGVIKLYGDQCEQKNEAEFIYYVLMELANIDWENEIKKRSEIKKFYTEGELMEILNQLISSFALLQKNNVTHRDIKPQNILIVNNRYKICDFGEAKIISTNGVIQQNIRGTELYMSPILFKALNSRQNKVIHNTYKSDVFSLGMCILLAATLTYQSLYDIRELDNMESVKNILVKYLIVKYSYNFVGTLLKMLEINEDLRPDFIQLEDSIRSF